MGYFGAAILKESTLSYKLEISVTNWLMRLFLFLEESKPTHLSVATLKA